MKKINIAQEINCSLVSKLNKLVFLKEKYSKRIEEERLKQSQFSQSTQENNSMIHKLETASERKKIASEECSSVDDSLQLKNCRLNEDINSMLNMLGLDIDVCEYENKRDIIKLMLKGSDIYIKLLFDVQTDDFDIIEIHPSYENFQDIRTFFRETGDLQGILSALRNGCLEANIDRDDSL